MINYENLSDVSRQKDDVEVVLSFGGGPDSGAKLTHRSNNLGSRIQLSVDQLVV